MQIAAETQPSSVHVAETSTLAAAASAPMDVDEEQHASSDTRGKRKADDEPLIVDSSKKPRVEQKPLPLKRYHRKLRSGLYA